MTRQGVVAATLVVAAFVMSGLGVARAADDTQQAVAQATGAAQAWLKLVDDGGYKESWEQASAMIKDRVGQDTFAAQVGAARRPLGRLLSRKLMRADYVISLPGAPDGKYVVIQYETRFLNKSASVETITPMLDSDGKWRVSGYYIK